MTAPSISGRPAAFLLLIASLLINARAQTVERVTVTAQSAVQRHLRISSRIRDAKYRQQLLELTPLGSTYEEVAAFVRAEIIFHNPKTPKWLVEEQATLRHAPAILYHIKEEPPIAKKITPLRRYEFQTGSDNLITRYTVRRSLFKRGFALGATYVFDDEHKLIDIFCYSVRDSPTGWNEL